MKTPSPPSTKGNILVVDDKPDNLHILSMLLTQQGYEVRGVVSGMMALRAVQSAPPHLILLDIMMPDMNGYEVCKQLKANPQAQHIPVIFISALDELFDKVQAFQSGGVDYISKPFQFEEVVARVQTHINLYRMRTALRDLNQDLEQRVAQRTAELELEIAERQRAQQQLLHLALNDPLTGLPNRVWFSERLAQNLNRAKESPSYRFAVLYLDCDRFKIVNDSLGHSLGDQLLISVAQRLEHCLEPMSMLARLGGDEFAILLEDVQDGSTALKIAEQVNRELSALYRVQTYDIFMNACIGIVIGDSTYEQPEHILRDADTAMYHAKSLGKGRCQFFDVTMHANARKRLQMESSLRRAAAKQNEFTVYYQPIISAVTHQITGFEALIRWPLPNGLMIMPGDFIKIAEETDLIIDIDLWMLQQACTQYEEWQHKFPSLSPFVISVNTSAKHFLPAHQPKLLEVIETLLSRIPQVKHHLKLEITEGTIIDDPQGTIRFLHRLKHLGIQLSIDDFGTGYSSLSYLHHFPLDTLKIDRRFVQQIHSATEEVGIIKTIAALGQQLGLSLIAEGVETEAQLNYLKAIRCQEVQGHLFCQAMPAAEATKLLARQCHLLAEKSLSA
jgi:diguanylate cyclase (GGDEF)-like protein